MRRSIWPVLLFAAIGVTILVSLGVWQLQRLAWKEGLIAEIDARMGAQAITLSEAIGAKAERVGNDYVKVRVKGKYLEKPQILMLAGYSGGPAYRLIQPFHSDEGLVILVDRGLLPEGASPPHDSGEVSFDALLRRRMPRMKRNYDPPNDPANGQWYGWDIIAMLRDVQLPPGATMVTRNSLQRLPSEKEGTPPIALAPKAELRNNHLGYAITWFGLAVVLVVMTVLFVLRQRQEAR
jgi:surfeit locus 1 family protein